ncbi:hypothetical protein HBO32_30195 [Pseudomonas nitroreducens]|uniref:hypothetical protein n=1 Tax=Pseudomonas nitroreducens TaxID=46680 RepID=UPI001475014A|nr:hypothetical protein [Pseudomonas nitroreducens]NMZ77371.1 hypothetical protein [Pseudomonas nitroreducens]
MNVKVIDIKSGVVKTMPERYAKILVKAKRARWPEAESQQYSTKVMTAADPITPLVVIEPSSEATGDAPSERKKRGRKPKAQAQE